MKHIAKLVSMAVLTLMVSSVMLLAAYDVIVFQPVLARVLGVVQAVRLSPHVPLLERYLMVAHGEVLQFQVGKILLRESDRKYTVGFYAYAWGKLASIHLSPSEQVEVILSQADFGSRRYGVASVSQAMYGKTPVELSELEAATVIALIQAPSYYDSRPDRLIERRDTLVRRSHGNW